MAGSMGYSILAGSKVNGMKTFLKYFSFLVVVLYFFLGIFILVSPTFRYLPKEIKIIFSVFLFLYGAFRLARIWTKSREEDQE